MPVSGQNPQLPPEISDSELLKLIWAKVLVLDELSDRMKSIEKQMNECEKKQKHCDDRLTELEDGVENMEHDVEELKNTTANSVVKNSIVKVYEKITDLSNRNRRNNIVIHNVPEAEKESEDILRTQVADILAHMTGKEDLTIERVHRARFSPTNGTSSPRTIFVKFLNYGDRQAVIEAVPQLKGFKIGSNDIVVTDDIDPVTYIIHKKLVVKMKELRNEGKFAFIPFTVPRVIKFREKRANPQEKTKMQTWRLPEETVKSIYKNYYA
jgi:hypothetical protein